MLLFFVAGDAVLVNHPFERAADAELVIEHFRRDGAAMGLQWGCTSAAPTAPEQNCPACQMTPFCLTGKQKGDAVERIPTKTTDAMEQFCAGFRIVVGTGVARHFLDGGERIKFPLVAAGVSRL